MTFLQKLAAAAAKKAVLKTLIEKAPADIKGCVAYVCEQAKVVDALQEAVKSSGGAALSEEFIKGLDIPELCKEKLLQPAVLEYLQNYLQNLKGPLQNSSRNSDSAE